MAGELEHARWAARHCLEAWARVQPGEQVLLLRDTGDFVEDRVVDVFREMVTECGATFSTAGCAVFNPRTEEPPPPVARALEAADAVLFFSPYPALIHSKAGRRAMFEFGLRLVPILTNTLELLASPWARFPVELQYLLHHKCYLAAKRDRRVRVTSRQGTDISGLIPDTVSSVDREQFVPGLCWHGIWPGECGPCLEPMAEMNGVIVLDVLPGFKGMLREKIRVEVRDNRIRGIEGGAEADWFRRFVDDSLRGGSDADVLYELQWGINPKGDLQHALTTTDRDEVEISRIARTLHFGFGSGTRGFHWDTVIVDGFDVTLGDRVICRDGRLAFLDDPEVRRAAAKYGDPDEVLSELSAAR